MIPAHALAAELQAARPSRAAGHRRARRAHSRACSRASGPCPARRAARRRAARLAKGGSRIVRPAGRRRSGSIASIGPTRSIGFGGYPAFPRCSPRSATADPDRAPRAECGARPGQPAARRRSVDAIATAYDEVERLEARATRQGACWSAIRCAKRCSRFGELPFPPFDEDGAAQVLVTGGSQGASILSQVVPEGLGMLPSLPPPAAAGRAAMPARRHRAVRAQYAELGIPAELATYIEDMPEKLADAHLVIARAGASTIAELTAAGRPAILVPLPRRDRRSPDRQRARDGQGGRRAGDRPGELHARSYWREQIEALALDPRGARQCRRRALVGRAPARRARPRRPGRARRQRRRAARRRPGALRREVTADGAGGGHAGMMKALGTDIGTIHFVGIGGIGMSGIAEVMHKLGYKVQGSDARRRLCRRGAAQGRHPGRDRP